MVAKQRIRMANEKHSKNITQRGNVAKTTVSLTTTLVSVRKVWKTDENGENGQTHVI